MKSLKLVFLSCALTFAFAAASAKADLVIDASGPGGHDASNGRNGSGAGGHATSAGKSTKGDDAGNIEIRLSDIGDGMVTISGSHSRTFSTSSDRGQIVLKANGGRGGSGGNGGDGQTGYTGSRGRDATRHSRGSDGGRGGPGGDGGEGSSGSSGGNAGQIVVRVKEKDMHLLYLLATPQVGGGSAGQRGRNGSGGSGGSGGPGGSSFSWQEPYTSTCSESYSATCSGTKSVSNGNGTSTTVSYNYSCTKTRSVSCTKYRTESNSGGSYGPSGSRGRDGNASLSDGLSGRNGAYKYIVEFKDGRTETYDRPFDLVVTGFELAADFNDEFVQPGEKLKVTGVTITNRGGMPSPTLTPVRLRVDADTSGAVTSTSLIDVKTSIAPGGSLTVNQTLDSEILRGFLAFDEQDQAKHRGGPKRDFKLGVSAEIVGINRYSNRLSSVKPLNVRFPISISRVLGKRSIGQGDDYLFRWAVDNHSVHQLGSSSTAHRHVRFVSSFTFNNRERGDTFYLRAGGADSAMPGTQDVSAVLGRSGKSAQESSLMWARLGFSKDAQLLDEGTLKIIVEVEDPYIKGKYVQVDVAYFPVKVGNAFMKSKNADVLLVTNPQTTQAELAAWKALVASSGRSADVWDVGIMGALDIGRQEIAQHYAGGTIVVLNDLVKQPGEEAVPADAMFKLVPGDFVRLAKEHHIGLFILDRTGSYKSRAGGYGSHEGRASDMPMLVAVKVNEAKFKDPAYIQSDENRVNLAMSLSFDRKLEAFTSARSIEALKAYRDAIASDLVLEQIHVHGLKKGTKEQLALLSKVVAHGLIDPIDGSQEQALNGEKAQLVLELIARMEFLYEADMAVKDTGKLLMQWVGKTYKAEDGWFVAKERKQAYKRVITWVEKRVKELKKDAGALEDAFVGADKSRFFKFPRVWNGDYYRQAAVSLILRPVFDRTYTHKLELFDFVLEKERLALPAFH